MSALQRLPTGTPASDSQVPFLDTPNGRDSKASLADFAEVLQGLLTPYGAPVTQYANPGASGFSITVAPPTSGASVFLLVSAGGAYAAGTIVLPQGAADGQEVLVHMRQAVTTLTITPQGDTMSGAPTTIGAAGFFRMRYDLVGKLWCRVG
jgi:hypothetical protein